MHSSISAHIASDYLLNASTGAWGRNLALFEQRLGNPDVRERVENLYFTYLFTLRALQKAGPLLDQLEYDTGMPAEDQRTKELVHRLVRAALGVDTIRCRARSEPYWSLLCSLCYGSRCEVLAPPFNE